MLIQQKNADFENDIERLKSTFLNNQMAMSFNKPKPMSGSHVYKLFINTLVTFYRHILGNESSRFDP